MVKKRWSTKGCPHKKKLCICAGPVAVSTFIKIYFSYSYFTAWTQNPLLRYFMFLQLEPNGMLHHSLGGAVIFISWQHFIFPSLTYCPACKPKIRGIAIRAVSQVRQNKVLLRNKNYCPETNEWCILFCQPKATLARSCNIPLVD